MPNKYVIELQPSVWLTVMLSGERGKTLRKRNAEAFASREDAKKALAHARTFCPFASAVIYAED